MPRHLTSNRVAQHDAMAERGAVGAPSSQGGRRGAVKASQDGALETADEAGLREAFLAHGGELFGFARRSLNSTQNAEDVVQETFSRAWRSRARFDPSLGSLRTWLFAIERRVIYDVSAHVAKNAVTSIDRIEERAGDDTIEGAMLGWQIESALQRLDPDHRMIVTELYFNARSGREVAELFGLPEGTVRSRAFYALKMLRLLLEEDGWNQ
jgi:RNA polymerase sigma-70 factor (ECF subfamily)